MIMRNFSADDGKSFFLLLHTFFYKNNIFLALRFRINMYHLQKAKKATHRVNGTLKAILTHVTFPIDVRTRDKRDNK